MARTPSKRASGRQKAAATPLSSRRPGLRPRSSTAAEAWGEEAERARELLRNARGDEESGEEEDQEMVDAEENEDEDEDDEDGSLTPSPSKGKGKERATPQKRVASTPNLNSTTFLPTTSSDAYFVANAAGSRAAAASSSSRTFSSLPQLSAAQMSSILSRPHIAQKHAAQLARLRAEHAARFAQFAFELKQGFNLLWFGLGSKRTLLDQFARDVCAKVGHVVILNGYLPSISYASTLSSLLSLPFVPNPPPPPTHSSSPSTLYHALSHSPRPLYIIIHSLDAAGFLTAQVRSLLALLALHPNCHLVASLDKLNAPLLFTPRELMARKHAPLDYTRANDNAEAEEDSDLPAISPQRGFGFVWHDLTTFAHYTAELAPRASGASASGTALASASGAAAGHLDAVATAHILQSVTSKSRSLFMLLGQMQLAALASPADADAVPLPADAPKYASPVSQLSARAREGFVATSEVAFRALLAEFRDHGLVGIAGGGGGGGQEVLWVNVAEGVLRGALKGLEEATGAGA